MGCDTLLEAVEPQHWSKVGAGGWNRRRKYQQAQGTGILQTFGTKCRTDKDQNRVYVLDFVKSAA